MSISVTIPKLKLGHCRKVRGVVETVPSSEEVCPFFYKYSIVTATDCLIGL
ncbi:MAG: hypothetical protein ACXVZU_02860 [Methanobacteriaceae archaeon]